MTARLHPPQHRRFWLRFDRADPRVDLAGLGWGCGVTAVDLEDASALVRSSRDTRPGGSAGWERCD